MAADRSEAASRGWETRREKHDPRGHGRPFRQVALCPTCARLRDEIEKLRQRLGQIVHRETSERFT
jgi:hypothetical protein